MARFSGALQLTDLDDFITPSQVRGSVCTPSPPFTRDKGGHSIKCALSPSRGAHYPASQECIKPVKVEKTPGKVRSIDFDLFDVKYKRRFSSRELQPSRSDWMAHTLK